MGCVQGDCGWCFDGHDFRSRIRQGIAQRRAVLPANGGYHILRHTFCSHLAMQGATPKAIQELAGHQDLTTTKRYMHLSPAHKDAAIRLLDRRPLDDGDDVPADDHIGRIKSLAVKGSPAPTGAGAVGDGLETGLRPEPESSRSE